MISKGCLYHIVIVKYLVSETPPNDSVPIVREFTEVFQDNLLGIFPEWEIYFGIELLLNTNLISIQLITR